MKLTQKTNPMADTTQNPMREDNSRKAWKYERKAMLVLLVFLSKDAYGRVLRIHAALVLVALSGAVPVPVKLSF